MLPCGAWGAQQPGRKVAGTAQGELRTVTAPTPRGSRRLMILEQEDPGRQGGALERS